jgi:hypothetical protein
MARSKPETSAQSGSERPADRGSARRGHEQPAQGSVPGGRPDAARDEPVAHVAEYAQKGSRWDVWCSCGSFREHAFLRVAALEAHQRHLRQVAARRPRRARPTQNRQKPATEPDRTRLRQHRPSVKQYGHSSWAVVCACGQQGGMAADLAAALGLHLGHLHDVLPRARELVAGHATGVKQVGDHWLVICRCGWKGKSPQRAKKAAIEHFEHLLAAAWDQLPAGGPARASRQPNRDRRGGATARGRQRRIAAKDAKPKPRPPVIVAVSLAEERDRRRLELLRRLGAPMKYGDE